MNRTFKFRIERLEDRNAPGTFLDGLTPLAMWGADLPLLDLLNSSGQTSAILSVTSAAPVVVDFGQPTTTGGQTPVKQVADLQVPLGDTVGDGLSLVEVAGAVVRKSGPGVAGPGAILPGFDSDSLPRCDDCTHATPSPLGFSMTVNGFTFDSMRVYSNGFISILENTAVFLSPGLVGSPAPLAELQVNPPQPAFLAAAYWGDADLRGSGTVTYGQGLWYDSYPAWGATWTDVGYYDQHADMLNTFQIVLVDLLDGANYLIVYNYASLTWQSGDFAPNLAPRVGWTRLNATDGVEAAGSGEFGTMIDSGTIPLNSYDDAFGLGFGSGITGSHWAFVA